MAMSNLLQGISYIITVTVKLLFAVIWFPNHELHLAIVIDLIIQNVGLTVGSILPPIIINHCPTNHYYSIRNHTEQETWKGKTHNTLLLLYITCAVVVFVLLLVFVAFMVDQPLKPPIRGLVKRTASDTFQSNNFAQFLELLSHFLKIY